MSIRGIGFDNIFSNRTLRFDSQKNNNDIAFEGKKKINNDTAMVKYGFPRPDNNRPNQNPPMLKYATPPIPIDDNNDNKSIIEKIKIKFGPTGYLKYAIPGHFND